ncbi:transporter substrate-binding domain-containing protein [Chitinivorax sp. B]|uniref:transporter substrate-binding domain-containing protein n=1 Tax=Chitinivorax sp. B TaxID=2502235 RepID=UPI0020172AF9|nr:transporter substrate-binding domain-containing protein [Chitinivorax sp. B]
MFKQLVCCGFCLLLGIVSAAETITYPKHQAVADPQLDYVLSVLHLALSKSGKAYELKQSRTAMVQSRAMLELKQNSGKVDVIWAMTDPIRESELLPIRIPIDRGLIGWRIALIRQGDERRFASISTLHDWAPLIAGQMHDWPDTGIMRSNGLTVSTTSNYESLFEQLAAKRIDYFPRSVIEVIPELDSHRKMGLAIEPMHVLRYRTAFYFFVSPKRPELAEDITRGLEAAIRDASLEALFWQHFGQAVRMLNLTSRRVTDLDNPLLPAATPLNRRELWFDQLP